MTAHYHHHHDNLPATPGALIAYVRANYGDFEQSPRNPARYTLDLGVHDTATGGGWEARNWTITMMGNTIVHFGPSSDFG